MVNHTLPLCSFRERDEKKCITEENPTIDPRPPQTAKPSADKANNVHKNISQAFTAVSGVSKPVKLGPQTSGQPQVPKSVTGPSSLTTGPTVRESLLFLDSLHPLAEWGEYLPQDVDKRRLAWMKQCKSWRYGNNDDSKADTLMTVKRKRKLFLK